MKDEGGRKTGSITVRFPFFFSLILCASVVAFVLSSPADNKKSGTIKAHFQAARTLACFRASRAARPMHRLGRCAKALVTPFRAARFLLVHHATEPIWAYACTLARTMLRLVIPKLPA
jgi:hypothetical protein